MKRALVAAALLGATCLAIPGATQATPLMPFQGLNSVSPDLLQDVRWRNCWRDRWGRLHCRTCWRDRWGRTHCNRW